MSVTLSQPIERPADAPSWPHALRILSRIGILVLFAMAIACDRVEVAKVGDLEPPSSTHFEWPTDVGQPTLTVEVEYQSSDDSEAGRKMRGGMIVIELMPELAPNTVAHVIDLAKNGYYDGTTFHRVIPGFMIQGGDPNSRDRDPSNDGSGKPEIQLDDEFGDAPFVRDVVGMGNLGRPNSSGSQFFIMHADNRSLDGKYTVIGRVISGIEVVDAITQVSIDRIGRWGPKDRPIENVTMKRVSIRGPVAPLQGISFRTSDNDEGNG